MMDKKLTAVEKIKEKPRGWANLQKQLEEVRNESFKQGFWAGENSKHKSDLQQELDFLEDKRIILDTSEFNGTDAEIVREEIEERINLIKKELENLENG